jgi:hypothetical protein
VLCCGLGSSADVAANVSALTRFLGVVLWKTYAIDVTQRSTSTAARGLLNTCVFSTRLVPRLWACLLLTILLLHTD